MEIRQKISNYPINEGIEREVVIRRIAQWVTSIFIGYLFAPLVTMIIPKDVVYIPKEKRKLFFKGSYTPIPLTFVWILPKFL